MSWLRHHAGSLEAIAAVATALIALAALVAVKYQLDAADTLQRAQSARDAYRSHLALASTLPQFAKPDDACELINGKDAGAYFSYVDHLLYSAEQMLEVEQGWDITFSESLEPHAQYLCSDEAPSDFTSQLSDLLKRFQQNACQQVQPCS